MKRIFLNLVVASAMTLVAVSCSKKSNNTTQKPTPVVKDYTSGQSYKFQLTSGSTTVDAIEYIAGDKNSKLILTAPHGGATTSSFLRTRTSDYNYGSLPADPYNNSTGFASGADLNTKELTLSLADSIKKKTGIRPHVIINLLHRSKLDANRRIEVAAQGDKNSEKAWNAFMNYIEDARKTLLANNSSGLLIDMHGNGHTPQRTEVGYLLDKIDFTNKKNDLGSLAINSSIYAMVNANATMPDLIKGDFAIGTLINTKTSEVVTPSKAYPEPGNTLIFTDGEYFNGGYITSRFSSKQGRSNLSSFQLEFNSNIRSNNNSTRSKFAGQIADAIKIYMEKYF